MSPAFNPIQHLKELDFPLVEVGGPTPHGYCLIDCNQLPRRLLVSNIFAGLPKFRGTLLFLEGKVDFRADGRCLPLRDESVAALFGSSIGGAHFSDKRLQERLSRFTDDYKMSRREKSRQTKVLRQKIIVEARRVLIAHGLLVWQGGNIDADVEFALKLGFELRLQKCSDSGKLRACILENI
ncbi:hypothetical protein D6821_02745 [Candidatus Parcubacteria bacterium]|nr:MAG: hypothetical protein D6821_02745 [Candidatus Parcubacteria bacterium]